MELVFSHVMTTNMVLQCIVCGEHKEILFCASSGKKAFDNDIPAMFLLVSGMEVISDSRICRKCLLELRKSAEFKRKICEGQLLARSKIATLHSPETRSDIPNKRPISTPKNPTPKRRVVDQIISSVEKLSLSDQEKGHTWKVGHAKKKLQFEDEHNYHFEKSSTAIQEPEEITNLDTDYLNKEFGEKIIANILKSFSSISKKGCSLLFDKSSSELNEENYFHAILVEMKTKIPFLYDLLDALIGNVGCKSATICTIYGMLMHSRNMQASSIQRLWTAAAIKCHADNGLLGRLNKINLTLSISSKRTIIKEFGSDSTSKIFNAIKDGKNGKINGDNLDLHVTTNDIRMNNKNSDYHFFASDWTPFRLNDEDFNNNTFLRETTNNTEKPECSLECFVPSEKEILNFKNSTKYLVARELSTLPAFKWMELVVPKHIEHPLATEMSRKSESFILPILLKNETKYEDCVEILNSYVHEFEELYAKAGRGGELNSLRIPIGGDQLTRVRFDVAKSLRMGTHSPQERQDCLYPIIVEMFHTQMDFVEKMIKRFMKKQAGRSVGTLAHIKSVIQRTNVNGNVKSRFKAHEDFIILFGRALLYHFFLEHFGMDCMDGTPKKNVDCIPSNIERTQMSKREAVFNDTMQNVLSKIFGTQSFQEEFEQRKFVSLNINGDIHKVPVEDEYATFFIQLNKDVKVEVPKSSLEQGKSINININGNNLSLSKIKEDDLFNYMKYFMQHYLLLIYMKDAICEGDIFRLNISLKLMIPYLYAHSHLSKYLVECIDYILKTEIILSPRTALEVRTASLVNPKGGLGNNKPTDMQKENQVKELKELIKGLGANKTENAIVDVCKAAPIINSVVKNLDKQINHQTIESSHHKREDDEDLHLILKEFTYLKPFTYTPGRMLKHYNKIPNSVYSELFEKKQAFHSNIMTICERLIRNFPVESNEDGNSSDNNDEEDDNEQ